MPQHRPPRWSGPQRHAPIHPVHGKWSPPPDSPPRPTPLTLRCTGGRQRSLPRSRSCPSHPHPPAPSPCLQHDDSISSDTYKGMTSVVGSAQNPNGCPAVGTMFTLMAWNGAVGGCWLVRASGVVGQRCPWVAASAPLPSVSPLLLLLSCVPAATEASLGPPRPPSSPPGSRRLRPDPEALGSGLGDCGPHAEPLFGAPTVCLSRCRHAQRQPSHSSVGCCTADPPPSPKAKAKAKRCAAATAGSPPPPPPQMSSSFAPAEVKSEIVGGRAAISDKCGIPLEDIRGYRSPYLTTTPVQREVRPGRPCTPRALCCADRRLPVRSTMHGAWSMPALTALRLCVLRAALCADAVL